MNVKLGWRIGKGHKADTNEHRMVDIILAKPGDLLSKTLPRLVCRLHLDKHLGILMAHRLDRSKGDIEIKIDNSWENFGPGEAKPLYRTSSWLRAGRCDYELRYAVHPSQREQFLARRDRILGVEDKFNIQTPQNATEVQITLPHLPALTYVPGDPMWTNSRYVRLGTIGSGGFGYIREGFSINTCQRIAIKELRLNRYYDCEILLNELDVMRKLQGSHGIISCGDCHCEHGNPKPCRTPETFSMCFPQAIHDFSKLNWFRGYNLQLRLQLLREPLLGLYEMHEKGIMHRDITIGNMLVLSYDPPQAVLSDFGKAIHKPDSNDTYIGPIASLAPEVWTAKEGEPYNNAIDVWAYGQAVATVLKCGGKYTQKDHSEGITKETHAYTLEKLDSHARQYEEEADLIDLIKLMLTWDSSQRITAQLALAHQCWDRIPVHSVKRSFEGTRLDISEQQDKVPASTPRSTDGNTRASATTQLFGKRTQEWFEHGLRDSGTIDNSKDLG